MSRAWMGAAALLVTMSAGGCAHDAPAKTNTTAAAAVVPEAESVSVVPPDAPPKMFYRNVSPATMGDDLKQQPQPMLPEEVKLRSSGSEVTGTYVVGVDMDGSVSRIDVLQSIPGADNTVLATIQKWKFAPREQRVRFLQRFTFSTGHQ